MDYESDSDSVCSSTAHSDVDGKDSISFQVLDVCRRDSHIQLFGKDLADNKYNVKVFGCNRTFYVKLYPIPNIEAFCEELKSYRTTSFHFISASIVSKKTFYGYQERCQEYVCITTRNKRGVMEIKKHIERLYTQCDFFETTYSITDEMVFMRDVGLKSWIKIDCVPDIDSCGKITAKVEFDQLTAINSNAIVKLKVVSFDIECKSREGIFPDHSVDPIIQIATCCDNDKILFSLGSCDAIDGAEVKCFNTERDLLDGWAKYIKQTSPDVLTGYNIVNFDIPYIIGRMDILRVAPIFGKENYPCTAKKSPYTIKGREQYDIDISGTLIFDVLPFIESNKKLRSYKLDSVAREYLKMTKVDVHYTEITPLFEGDSSTRAKLGKYCIQDAELPKRLMDHFKICNNHVAAARVCGISIMQHINIGSMAKTTAAILQEIRDTDLILPDKAPIGSCDFKGATVLEPICNLYNCPIITFDFASMYPSIICSHNICYSTLLDDEQAKIYNHETSPTNAKFIDVNKFTGILPTIVKRYLNERKRVRALLAIESDETMKVNLDCEQLALKVAANAVYGCTGAKYGLTCIPVSSSITSYGRELILETKKFVEEKFAATVIYGDTDSVMIRFENCNNVKEAYQMANKAIVDIETLFRSGIKLEFEKVYFPYMLCKKKRYIGIIVDENGDFVKIDSKGTENIRRDFCEYTRNVLTRTVELALIEKRIDAAEEYLTECIEKLCTKNVDLNTLILSKQFTKLDYKNKQPHSEIAKRERLLDPNNAPKIGERVDYLIIKGNGNLASRARRSRQVFSEGLEVDYKYYIENQLRSPCSRLFELIFNKNKEEALRIVNSKKKLATGRVYKIFQDVFDKHLPELKRKTKSKLKAPTKKKQKLQSKA